MGALFLLLVKFGGNRKNLDVQYLGAIDVPAGGSANNLTTASPFHILNKFTAVLVQTPVSVSVFNVLVGTGVGLLSDATQFAVAGDTSNEFVTQIGAPLEPVVAIYSPGGGTCKVFGLYGLATIDQPST